MSDKAYNNWLDNVSGKEKEELLLIKDDASEIKERFSVELQFGTAGMRGEVGLGTNRMNVYTVKRATAGLAKFICSLGQAEQKKGVVIAYDTRRFSKEFALAAAGVLGGFGVKAYIFEDVRPVPMCSFAVRHLGAAAGIMVTASHNPKEYNGYKVYGPDGAQMSPESTEKVVRYITATEDFFDIPYLEIKEANIKDKDGYRLNAYVTVIGKTLDEAYYSHIEKLSLSPELTQKAGKDIKLVYTPVHGSGYRPVMTIFERLGIFAETVKEQVMPDTEFRTVQVPNPENADTLKMGIELGKKIGADVVLATDPDCDRLGAAVKDDKGQYVLLTGNQIGVLLLDYICIKLNENKAMPKNAAVVKSFVTTTLADRLAESYGVTVFNVLTGFKFIGEKIKEWEESGEYTYIFGFEESYGTLRGTHARDKDAVVGSMLFAEMLLYHESKGKSVYGRLQEIFKQFGYYTEKNASISYKGLSGMEDMKKVMESLRKKNLTDLAGEKILYTVDYLSGVKTYSDGTGELSGLPVSDAVYYGLSDNQFICIRPSGTEPKLKIYILLFADTPEKSADKANAVLAAIKKELN